MKPLEFYAAKHPSNDVLVSLRMNGYPLVGTKEKVEFLLQMIISEYPELEELKTVKIVKMREVSE